MIDFYFKHLLNLKQVLHPEVSDTLIADPELKVVYLLPYNSRLALLSLRKLVQDQQLPWDETLVANELLGDFKNAPVVALTNASYITAVQAELSDSAISELQKLIALYGNKLKLVLAFPQWGTALISRPNYHPDTNGIWLAIVNLWRGLSLRNHGYIKLLEVVNVADLSPDSDAQELATSLLAKYSRITQVLTPTHKELCQSQVIEQVLEDELVRDAISVATKKSLGKDNQSQDYAQAEQKQVAEARSILREIAADPSFFFTRILGVILKFLWKRFYSDIKVYNMARIEKKLLSSQKATMLYLPTHRSHIDYLFLSYVLNEYSGLKIPQIAAGINLNFFIVGKFFRKGGAFFIRRTFNNYLYSKVFSGYMNYIINNQVDFEFFVEGGRSRTGRLLTPKTGIFNMTLQSYIQNPNDDLYITPIFISYDKVFESETYVNEMKGQKKIKESAWLVLRNLKKIKYQGNAYANFAAPITLKEYVDQIYPTCHQDYKANCLDMNKFDQLSYQLREALMTQINTNSVVSGVSLLASALYLHSGKASLSKLDSDLTVLIEAMNYYTNFNKECVVTTETPQQIISKTLDVYAKGVVVATDTEIEFSEQALEQLNYTRNMIEHVFYAPALGALAYKKGLAHNELGNFVAKLHPVLNKFFFTDIPFVNLFATVACYYNFCVANKDKNDAVNLLAKQIYAPLTLLHTFLAQAEQAIDEANANGKELNAILLSSLTNGVIESLKAKQPSLVDLADKATVTQMRTAIKDSNYIDFNDAQDVKAKLAFLDSVVSFLM